MSTDITAVLIQVACMLAIYDYKLDQFKDINIFSNNNSYLATMRHSITVPNLLPQIHQRKLTSKPNEDQLTSAIITSVSEESESSLNSKGSCYSNSVTNVQLLSKSDKQEHIFLPKWVVKHSDFENSERWVVKQDNIFNILHRNVKYRTERENSILCKFLFSINYFKSFHID